MSYQFNKVAKFELKNFKRVVEIFCLSIDLKSHELINVFLF